MLNNYFNSRREQLVRYAITKETYPPDTQRGIEFILRDSSEMILGLDEFDKVNRCSKEGDPMNVFLRLFQGLHYDKYLQCHISTENTIFIATANSIEDIPETILNRFNAIIYFDEYTYEDKFIIAKQYVIPDLLKIYNLSSANVAFEDSAIKYIIKLVNQTGEVNWMKIAISIDDVRKYLGEEPIPRGNFPSEAVSGVSKALAVSDNKGSTFAIETRLLEGEETLEITGLPKEMAVDSVRVAVTCIKKMYPNILDKKHIHVHFGEGSVQKDGPSAGVALFMSILSAALNKPIIKENPYDISYTGELSLSGGIFAVGSIFQKIQAACDSGCSKVYIPEQNYERLDKDKISKYNCEVVPVANISEIVEDIYPELKEE